MRATLQWMLKMLKMGVISGCQYRFVPSRYKSEKLGNLLQDKAQGWGYRAGQAPKSSVRSAVSGTESVLLLCCGALP